MGNYKMKIKVNFSIIFLALLCSCSPLVSVGKTIVNASTEIKQGQMLPITATAEIAGEIINLEVAQTPEQQATGLMFRDYLAGDQGMLFPFKSARVASFWMKNVSISLDMIFLNGNKIVHIANDVPPCEADPCPVYGSDALVDRVLELRGGRAKELGVQPGDTINIQNLTYQ